MMFLVIFGSLATAMAIVAQGNLSTANAHLKINRALAAAETGLRFVIYRLQLATAEVTTRDGVIDNTNAPEIWDQTRAVLLAKFANDNHNLEAPYESGTALHVGPIAVGPNSPTFTANYTPHPLTGEDYGSDYYQRPPYSDMKPAISATNPLDSTWIRIRVDAKDGPPGHQIRRAIQMDFKIDKKIRYTILSKSRIMIGRNVMIEGQIGSRFTDTHLLNGHPIQMRSDFYGLDPDLDAKLSYLTGALILNDANGDNRLNLANPAELEGLVDPKAMDTDSDGFIDGYDFFLANYDINRDGDVTALELGVDQSIEAVQLLNLIDTFGDSNRPGYGDNVINSDDRYTKLRGQVRLTSDLTSWNEGAADGAYQDNFTGSIIPRHGIAPLTFQARDTSVHTFEASDFDVSHFHSMATGNLTAQAQTQAQRHTPEDPASPGPLGNEIREEVPYGAAHPYDYYDRPVYQNMTFTNILIPKGTNGLFKNCTFVGVTYIETEIDNNDPAFNLAGAQEVDGSPKHPNQVATVYGQPISDTKTVSNNIRFENCTFEGAVISGGPAGTQPAAFTHVRNKVAFTGTTRFVIEESANLNDDQKELFRRSTVLTPHYSLEIGSFDDPTSDTETVELSGAIVAGVLDLRGQVKLTGSLLTTFAPQIDTGPVIGPTSPQFNTTIGYFGSAAGDLEAEVPAGGVGAISLRYDPTVPLPDGILGPIEILPIIGTYFECRAE